MQQVFKAALQTYLYPASLYPHFLDRSRCLINVSHRRRMVAGSKVVTWLHQTANHPWRDRESRQLHSTILRLTCVYIYLMCGGEGKKNKNKSSITNIWRNGLLRWPSVPIRFQIYGNITVLAPAVCLSNVRPIYLLAFRTGGHTDAMLPARSAASHSASVSRSLHLPVCLNITICSYKMLKCVCASVFNTF